MVWKQETVQMESTGTSQDHEGPPSLPPLTIRAHGPGCDGEIVRFSAMKSTVGSDAACTYRICDDQIQPVECLILRGNGGSIVRRWGDGIRLNGQQFSDARLEPGDRLTIGSVELEVIEDHAPPALPADAPSQSEETLPAVCERSIDFEALEDARQELYDELRREIACLQDEQLTWKDERERWESELAGYRNLLGDLQAQFDEFQQMRQREHESWLEEVQHMQSLLEAVTQAAETPSVETGTLLCQESEGPIYSGDDGLLQDENPVAVADRFIYDEDRVPESEDGLEQEGTSPWMEDAEDDLERPDFLSEALAASNDSRDESSGAFLSHGMDASDAPCMTEEEVSSDATEEYEQPADEPDEEPSVTQSPNWLQQYQDQQDDADDSITDYMSRLLQRVGGDDETPSSDEARSVPASSSPSKEPPPSKETPESSDTEMSSEEQMASAQPEVPESVAQEDGLEGDFTPRNAAPERDTNMAAMRELANVSARSAIQTCDKNRTAKSAMGSIPFLVTELGIGGLLLYWASISNQAIAYAGAAIAFIAAALTGARTVGLLLKTALASLSMPRLRDTAKHAHEDGAS